ncbi:methyltransferase domain-containing protein, partial [Candidatus Woesearchaeota archaeon]|nr:methyltransferase domain-containing protein [Candidatus Woesearchaeota archaeon]
MNLNPYDKGYVFLSKCSHIFNEKILRFKYHEHNLILDWLPKDPKSKILDMGCNSGRLLKKIIKNSKSEVMGADINHYAIKRAKENGLKAKLIDNNFYKKYNEYFDAVLLSHVLEHVDIPE